MEDFNLKKYLTENKLLNEQEKTESGFAAVDSILKDIDDKLPQFKTIDTAPEFLALVDGIIERVTKGAPDFVESGRFIQAITKLYNRRKDYAKASKSQGDKDEESGVDPEVKALNDRGIYTAADARRAGLRLSSDMKQKLGE